MHWSAQSIQQLVQHETAGLERSRYTITRTMMLYDSFGSSTRNGAGRVALMEDFPKQGF
jgi:hypothetical protein